MKLGVLGDSRRKRGDFETPFFYATKWYPSNRGFWYPWHRESGGKWSLLNRCLQNLAANFNPHYRDRSGEMPKLQNWRIKKAVQFSLSNLATSLTGTSQIKIVLLAATAEGSATSKMLNFTKFGLNN